METIIQSATITHPTYLGGCPSISVVFIITAMLCNACHYDPRDMSSGISTWLTNKPRQLENWYFLCPHIEIESNGQTYYRLVIALNHGVQISWVHGCIIWHCTSETTTITNGTIAYSVFSAGSGPLSAN